MGSRKKEKKKIKETGAITLTSSFSKPIIVALDTGHKIVYYVFFPNKNMQVMSSTQMDPYVSSMCVLCNVGSLALHIIMYTYLPEKPTWYAKRSRGDYFK